MTLYHDGECPVCGQTVQQGHSPISCQEPVASVRPPGYDGGTDRGRGQEMRINRRYMRHCQACDENFNNGLERECGYHNAIDSLAEWHEWDARKIYEDEDELHRAR